ncbi:MAG TPA: superoxide dismutase [Terriglobia bacterium]|nr:superoxide dismutase [Terriglobia bacterium]
MNTNLSSLSRRDAIRRTALLGAVAAFGSRFSVTSAAEAPGAVSLPPLGYAYDALEPHIDAQTMQIHHDKHHAAYVANLNKALAGAPELAGKTIESLLSDLETVPEPVRMAVRNQGGGHANHALFWQQLRKNGSHGPSGDLAKAINSTFGDFAGFQKQFTEAATKQFGSGWAWLTVAPNKQIAVESTSNQDTPLSKGRTPLLGIDVWEHAYYLKYQNRRPEYITAFYQVIDWDVIAERFKKAVG